MIKWFKKHFIPHAENDHRPHFLRRKALLALALFIFLAEVLLVFQFFVVFNRTDFLAQILPSALVSLTNESRQEHDAPELSVNPLLKEAAKLKAKDMVENGYFAHTSPDGVSPWYWLGRVGYEYSIAGENLAVNFFNSADVARAWMNSPSHRDNIVNDRFTEIGIGTARGMYKGRHTVFVVQFFGSPVESVGSVAQEEDRPVDPVSEEEVSDSVALIPEGEGQMVVDENDSVEPEEESEVLAGLDTEVEEGEGFEEEEIFMKEDLVDQQDNALEEEGDERERDLIVAGRSALIDHPDSKSQILVSSMERIVTSPRSATNFILGIVSIVLALTLFLAVFVNIRKQHPYMLAGALSIIVLTASLLATNYLIFGNVTLPSDSLNANVINSFKMTE